MNVFVCSNGHAAFPERLLCPVCGSSEWRVEDGGAGVVELVTELADGTHLASVRLGAGPRVIARPDPDELRGPRWPR
jgi:uncharacterized OB-fold protein